MRESNGQLDPFTRLEPIAPPEHLDALVHQRMHAVLREQRSVEGRDAALSRPEALPPVERWVFALGLCSYGGQLVLSAARLIWRSFAG
jgi:hypothetical protein